MKLEFDSRNEIARLCSLLKEIYPGALCVSVDDLLDAKNNAPDRDLPWNFDGFHPKIEISDDAQAEKKESNKDQFYTYDQVFGRGTVWEEVEKDGKKYLRRVAKHNDPFTPTEHWAYEAGRIAMAFQLYRNEKISLMTGTHHTGRSKVEFLDLYHMWVRRAYTENKRRSADA